MNALDAIAFVAERKIEEALAEGQFDNLPGMGKPLELEDTSHLPPDIRMAYTILKNGGYLAETPNPNKPATMPDLLQLAPEEGQIYGKMQRLKLMMLRVRKAEALHLPEQTGKRERSAEDSPYLEKLASRV
jgi:hypothetical protein